MNKKITITEEDLVTMIKSIIQERKEVKEQSDKKKIKTILKQKACAKKYATVSKKLTDEGWRKLGEGEKRPSRFSKRLDRERIRDAKCNKEWWVRPKGQSDKLKEKSEKKYRIAGIALTNDFIQAVTTAAVDDANHPVVDSAVFDSASGATVDSIKEIFDNMLALQSLTKGLISWVKSDPKVCENRKINKLEVLKLHAVPNVEQVLGNIEALGKEIGQPALRMITKNFVKSAEDVLTTIQSDPDSKKEINDAGYRNIQQIWIKEARTRGEEFKKHIDNVEAWFDKVGCQVAEGKASKIKKDKYSGNY